jgi:hypothetical protein
VARAAEVKVSNAVAPFFDLNYRHIFRHLEEQLIQGRNDSIPGSAAGQSLAIELEELWPISTQAFRDGMSRGFLYIRLESRAKDIFFRSLSQAALLAGSKAWELGVDLEQHLVEAFVSKIGSKRLESW